MPSNTNQAGPTWASLPGRMVRKLWRKFGNRKLTASDDYDGLDRLYKLEDPWEMTSGREQFRFRETNRFIEDCTGRVGSLLELGCGEGHQSVHLAGVCDRLVGIDVSGRAVERATARLPSADFRVGDIAGLPIGSPRFDLVVACEMLYYVKDIPATLERMNQLGSACVVTLFSPSARIVVPHLASLPLSRRTWVYSDPYVWLFAFWRPGDRPGQSKAEGVPVL
jgi:SAM-dependent methyltransferase